MLYLEQDQLNSETDLAIWYNIALSNIADGEKFSFTVLLEGPDTVTIKCDQYDLPYLLCRVTYDTLGHRRAIVIPFLSSIIIGESICMKFVENKVIDATINFKKDETYGYTCDFIKYLEDSDKMNSEYIRQYNVVNTKKKKEKMQYIFIILVDKEYVMLADGSYIYIGDYQRRKISSLLKQNKKVLMFETFEEIVEFMYKNTDLFHTRMIVEI
jgi:hypothetical protein